MAKQRSYKAKTSGGTRKRTAIFKENQSLDARLRSRIRFKGDEGSIEFKIVTLSGRGSRHSRVLVVKTFRRPLTPVKEQFETLRSLKRIPELALHIPPTVRIIEDSNSMHPKLVFTDLTEGGKFLIKGVKYNFSNKPQVMSQIHELFAILHDNGYYIGTIGTGIYMPHFDAFLIQVNPATKAGVKVWVIDAGNIHRW